VVVAGSLGCVSVWYNTVAQADRQETEMFIKLTEAGNEEGIDIWNNHLFEADYVHYRWAAEYPDGLYLVPFERGEGPSNGRFLVISLFDGGNLIQEIVAFRCAIYIMNSQGRTVDKFAV